MWVKILARDPPPDRPKLNLRNQGPENRSETCVREGGPKKRGKYDRSRSQLPNCPTFSPNSPSCFLDLASTPNWGPCLGSFLALLANSFDFSQLPFHGCSNLAVYTTDCVIHSVSRKKLLMRRDCPHEFHERRPQSEVGVAFLLQISWTHFPNLPG